MTSKPWSESPILFDNAYGTIDDTDPQWVKEMEAKETVIVKPRFTFRRNFFSKWWKKQSDIKHFRQMWEKRNIRCSEVFVDSLEMPYLIFHQEIFLEDSPELSNKLERLGFKEIEEHFKDEVRPSIVDFCTLLLQPTYNIVLHLYPPQYEVKLAKAISIAQHPISETSNKFAVENSIFHNVLEVLNT